MKETPDTGRKAASVSVKKAGKVFRYVLTAILCGTVIVFCITSGIMLSQYANERAENTRTHLFDWIENNLMALKKRLGLEGQGTQAGSQSDADLQQQLIRQVREMAEEQAETDRLILAELQSGAYTLEEPFVLLDPYGISPLTAVLLFTTEKPVRIDIHVAGDTPRAEVDFAFSDYETEHMIPVYGLYAERANEVTVTATDEDGHAQSKKVTVQTDVLPAVLADVNIQAQALNEKMVQPGFTFAYNFSKMAIDINGDYRWYLDQFEKNSLLSQVLYGGDYNDSKSLFVACGTQDSAGSVLILEMNYLGHLLNAYYSSYGAHHDIEPDETGVLVTGAAGVFYENLIYHFDSHSGEIDKMIDFTDCMQIQRDQCELQYEQSDQYYSRRDCLHINTVVSYQDDLIVSMRNQSTVLRTDWNGNIKWMLCDPTGYYEYYKQFILTPMGDNFEYCYVQHSPEVLPDQDGDPDTVDILLFDNGDWRKDFTERTSRLIQYRINEKEMTVELIWMWGSDKPELYSTINGDADLLENGGRLGTFCPTDPRLNIATSYGVELGKDDSVVWEVWMSRVGGNMRAYRFDRLPIYAETANDLHIGEPANLFLPEE